ncbi:hypothetical protein [Pedobacter miscanthi]|uniref:hypothetical protein n=1 Tax=Pedobacter miscanthi TaxID=2259170 RepID=UPI00292E7755|nr:hypothetical protein [Pedobacter miscanthi]
MNNTNYLHSNFSFAELLSAALPSYAFAALMSFISGVILQDNRLIEASYTSIGLSSLSATVLSFIVLWQLDGRKIMIHARAVRTILIILFMVGLALLLTIIPQIKSERLNISVSAFIGTTVFMVRKHFKNYSNAEN